MTMNPVAIRQASPAIKAFASVPNEILYNIFERIAWDDVVTLISVSSHLHHHAKNTGVKLLVERRVPVLSRFAKKKFSSLEARDLAAHYLRAGGGLESHTRYVDGGGTWCASETAH